MDKKLEQTGSSVTKWATRVLVIILTIIVILIVIACWQNTKMRIDSQFNGLFSSWLSMTGTFVW